MKTFSFLGGQVDYYIPDRDTEGHGLNTKALVKLLTKKNHNTSKFPEHPLDESRRELNEDCKKISFTMACQ